jgi:tetratricopeptide (TPR) repeat protein
MSVSLFVLSPTLAQQGPDPQSPEAWGEVGALELSGGNLAGAQASFGRMLVLADERGDNLAAARASLNLGRTYSFRYSWMATDRQVAAMWGGSSEESPRARATFEKAEAAFEKALSLGKALDRKSLIADAYQRLGNLYRTRGELTRAQAMLERCVDLNKELGAKEQLAGSYRELGDVHFERRDFEQAEAMYKEALALWKAVGPPSEMAPAFADLGRVYQKRGQLDEAERLYQEGLAFADSRDRVSIIRALEDLYRARGDRAKTEQMSKEADALSKDTGGGLIIVSESYYVSGRFSRDQQAALESAVPLEKALGHQVGLATSYVLLGHHYQLRGDLDRAEAMFKDALALNTTLGRQDEVGHVYEALGSVLKSRGDRIRACAYWRKGASAFPNRERLRDLLMRGGC